MATSRCHCEAPSNKLSAENLITIPAQYGVNVDIDFSSDGAGGDGIIWVDSYDGETIQKLTVTVML